MSLRIGIVRAEFARRAIQFHKGEKLEEISLWGLFSWGAVSRYIKDGRVIPDAGFARENRTIWCKPSQAEIDDYIRPLTKTKTLEELLSLAGW